MTNEIFFKNICEACEDIDAQVPIAVIDRCCHELYFNSSAEDVNNLTYAGYRAIAERIQLSYDIEMARHFIESVKEKNNE